MARTDSLAVLLLAIYNPVEHEMPPKKGQASAEGNHLRGSSSAVGV